MLLPQHKSYIRKTELALEVKFQLDVRWVHMAMATNAHRQKWRKIRISALSPRTVTKRCRQTWSWHGARGSSSAPSWYVGLTWSKSAFALPLWAMPTPCTPTTRRRASATTGCSTPCSRRPSRAGPIWWSLHTTRSRFASPFRGEAVVLFGTPVLSLFQFHALWICWTRFR